MNKIPSQTSEADRISLLAVQRLFNNYTYLEIGSHKGGTLQTHYCNPKCKLIYSIDKRPQFQPDNRGITYYYNNNTTERMKKLLKEHYPNINPKKLITFDCCTSELNPKQITKRPQICFIDGEHTTEAVIRDFKFCLKVVDFNGIIGFHDASIVFEAIEYIKEYLKLPYKGLKLGGSVYVILLNNAKEYNLKKVTMDEQKYFNQVKKSFHKKSGKKVFE